MSLQSEKMSKVDTAWWHMEEPTNLMMIVSIMLCDGKPDYPRLRHTIASRLLPYDRFRQRVNDPGLLRPTRWELDPNFDLDAHIHAIALPSPGDQTALETLVSDLMSTPLDYTKPLWQVHIVEGCADGYALVFRLHHCLADGIALMKVLISLTDDTAEGPDLPAIAMPAPPQKSVVGFLTRPIGGAARLAKGAVTDVLGTANSAAAGAVDIVQNPGLAIDAMRDGLDFAQRLALVTLRPPDPPTMYKGELGSQKRAAWSAPAPLPAVKAAARALGGSVNDLEVTAFTGALRRYMEAQGLDTAGAHFRTYIPVNMRNPEDDNQLGNKFGLVFLQLPVGTVDRVERFALVKARMDELKNSPEAAVAYTLLAIAGTLPKRAESLAFSIYHAKSTGVFTNVPGPGQQLYIAGTAVRYMMGWVPQAGGLGLGISIFSYNDEIAMGLNTDAGLVPDPATIIGYYEDELAELLALSR
jgi:WS/DGAT/MGAT family acyltransferase